MEASKASGFVGNLSCCRESHTAGGPFAQRARRERDTWSVTASRHNICLANKMESGPLPRILQGSVYDSWILFVFGLMHRIIHYNPNTHSTPRTQTKLFEQEFHQDTDYKSHATEKESGSAYLELSSIYTCGVQQVLRPINLQFSPYD